MRTIVFLVLIGLYLSSVLVGGALFAPLISVATLAAVLVSWPKAGAVGRIMAGIFLVAGGAMLLGSGQGPVSLILGFGEMVYIVTLFSLLPVLSIPIRLFRYDQSVSHFFKAVSASTTKAYFGILFISYFLGSFLNLGTVPLVYRTVERSVEELQVPEFRKFIGISLTQGFIGPLVWTPFSGVLGVTLAVFGTAWLDLLPVLLVIGVVSASLSILVYLLLQSARFRDTSNNSLASGPGSKVTWPMIQPLVELFAIVLTFILAVLTLETVFHGGLVTTIIFATGPFMLIWVALKRGLDQLPTALRAHFQGHFESMSSTYLVFLTAGFFLSAFEVSGYNALVIDATRIAIETTGTLTFIVVFPLVVVGLAFLAIHPIVFLILISSALTTEVVGLSAQGMAVTFLAGGVLNFIISPYSGTVGLLRQMTHYSASEIIRSNLPTAVVTYLTFVAVTALVYL